MSSLIWVCTVCPDQCVLKLRIITVVLVIILMERLDNRLVDLLPILEWKNSIKSGLRTSFGKLVYLSRIVRKPAFCICENKGADQLPGNWRHCFPHIDSTVPLLS